MSFFRNIRSSLSSSSRAKSSSSRDTTPVRTSGSRPASVVSVGRASSSRRDSTTSSTLQRGDTFILPGSDEEANTHSNSSTLEKKSKKSKVFGKFSTFTKRKKTPASAPAEEEVASYEHHPSDTATNTYYKWRSDGGDRLQDYDAQSDPFNFLYEQHSNLRNLQSGSAGESSVHRQASIGSNSSGSFDSSTYRKSKTPTHLREQLEQLKTHSNDDLLEDQQREEDEREKYKTRLLAQQSEQTGTSIDCENPPVPVPLSGGTRPQSSPTRMQPTRMSVDPQQSSRLSVNQQQSSRMSVGHQQASQQRGGRTLVHIGSDQSRSLSAANPMPARGRAPTRVQLYGSKPQSRQQQQQQPSSTYFGGHYNAPATPTHTSSSANSAPLKQRGSSSGLGGATVYGGGVPTVYLGRREQPMTRAAPVPTRRNRSPIKMPWR
ncbi:GL20856 [Drosophila persimilis]|uniref:GL20856 n=1 Tax=Drosophila persimilis TaxID=7234 RepID=B4H4D3_DROPE|nr:GL20856 [Drosophila persimilis]